MSSMDDKYDLFVNYLNKNEMSYPCKCIFDQIQDYYFDTIHEIESMDCLKEIKHRGIRNIVGAYFKLCDIDLNGIIAMCDIMISLEQSNVLPEIYLEKRFDINCHGAFVVVLAYIYDAETDGEINYLLCSQMLRGCSMNDQSLQSLKFKSLENEKKYQEVVKYLRPLVSKRLESKIYNSFLPELWCYEMNVDMDIELIEYLNFLPHEISSANFGKTDLFRFLIKSMNGYIDHNIEINIHVVSDTFDPELFDQKITVKDPLLKAKKYKNDNYVSLSMNNTTIDINIESF